MTDESQRLPPGVLLRSFLIVGGGYCLSLLFFLASMIAIAAALFPGSYELLMNEEQRASLGEEAVLQILTPGYFWVLWAANVLFNLGLGYAAARIAPFARFPHGLFIALVVLISFLQQSMVQPTDAKWMYVLMMGGFSIAILIGARWGAAS